MVDADSHLSGMVVHHRPKTLRNPIIRLARAVQVDNAPDKIHIAPFVKHALMSHFRVIGSRMHATDEIFHEECCADAPVRFQDRNGYQDVFLENRFG